MLEKKEKTIEELKNEVIVAYLHQRYPLNEETDSFWKDNYEKLKSELEKRISS